MADGSLTLIGRGIVASGPNCPRLCDVPNEHEIVGCCDRCGEVGLVDRKCWKTPFEQGSALSTLRLGLSCIRCLCKSIRLQVWVQSPYQVDRISPFYRWR